MLSPILNAQVLLCFMDKDTYIIYLAGRQKQWMSLEETEGISKRSNQLGRAADFQDVEGENTQFYGHS